MTKYKKGNDYAPADEARKELTMVLMYLLRFTQPRSMAGQENFYAWKGYDFDILKALDGQNLICLGAHPSRTKSIYLTASGMDYGKRLMEKYGIQDWENTRE